ncbi:hypothetical protein CYMTET_19833 [Cymbomonas tetramitiformis]|uniref:Uncharacterized protein n=1 Tax=Cymbomonas tetramitiformis TaxID=36881 RepID=A0AAE0G5B0_9CHLO|nr:hypothetical protein CYMTET_19833 [Cymbomonas tetramitiformis]
MPIFDWHVQKKRGIDLGITDPSARNSIGHVLLCPQSGAAVGVVAFPDIQRTSLVVDVPAWHDHDFPSQWEGAPLRLHFELGNAWKIAPFITSSVTGHPSAAENMQWREMRAGSSLEHAYAAPPCALVGFLRAPPRVQSRVSRFKTLSEWVLAVVQAQSPAARRVPGRILKGSYQSSLRAPISEGWPRAYGREAGRRAQAVHRRKPFEGLATECPNLAKYLQALFATFTERDFGWGRVASNSHNIVRTIAQGWTMRPPARLAEMKFIGHSASEQQGSATYSVFVPMGFHNDVPSGAMAHFAKQFDLFDEGELDPSWYRKLDLVKEAMANCHENAGLRLREVKNMLPDVLEEKARRMNRDVMHLNVTKPRLVLRSEGDIKYWPEARATLIETEKNRAAIVGSPQRCSKLSAIYRSSLVCQGTPRGASAEAPTSEHKQSWQRATAVLNIAEVDRVFTAAWVLIMVATIGGCVIIWRRKMTVHDSQSSQFLTPPPYEPYGQPYQDMMAKLEHNAMLHDSMRKPSDVGSGNSLYIMKPVIQTKSRYSME